MAKPTGLTNVVPYVCPHLKVNTKRVTPSTLASIRDEMLKSHFLESISPTTRTSLRTTFARLPVLLREQIFIPVSLETGSAAILHGNFCPDLVTVKTSMALVQALTNAQEI